MERKVNFYDDMDVDPADMNNVQTFVQNSLDNIVADTITAEARYANFGVAKSGPTTVRVAPGELFSGGKVFTRAMEYTTDFVSSLPVAGKKIAAIVVWGTEIETDVRPREFLINEETLESEPRPMAMEKARLANINTAMGTEAPDPVPPLVNAGLTIIAYVLLSPTGVETVTMNAEAALPQLGKVSEQVKGLNDWKDKIDPQVSTIKTDIAKLANSVSGTATTNMVLRIAADVARLKDKAGIPDNRIDYGADHFLDTSETDINNLELLCKTEEGIRFGAEAESLSQLQVFDNLDPRHKIVGGMLMPAFERVKRLEVGPRTGELSIAQYQYQTHELTQLSRSRQRTRYGEEFTVCTNTAWWQSGNYDPISGIFTRNGETFQVGHDVNFLGGGSQYHQMMRVRRVFVDTYEEPYWDYVTTPHTVQGAQIAQTFPNVQDGWLEAIGLLLTRLANDGTVTVAITEVSGGKPDPKRVISITTVNRDKLKLNEYTVLEITPTYLQAGRRYGMIVTTNGDHWVATTDGYAGGTLFYSTDGDYLQGDLAKDICFQLYFAQFKTSRVEIALNPLQLSGGIAAIDILAETIAPASTEFFYEIQVDSRWHPLREVQQTALIGLPPLLQLRAVFVGTPDMMPSVSLSGSQVYVSRPRTTYKHITTPRTLPALAQNIMIKNRLEYFEEAYHTNAARLLTGDNYQTATTPVSVTDEWIPEESAVVRTSLFQLPTKVQSYKIETTGTTSTALKTYHVAERVDIALS